MGVVLSSNPDINLARKNADEAARKIKVSNT
jgi:phosphoribosylglycinamide formyltransferase 2